MDRDVRTFPHSAPTSDFETVGDIFSQECNPERKKPFDIRTVMRAVADQDHPPLERWAAMADAESAVVFDGSYTRMLWMGLRTKAAYLPGC